MFCKDIGTVWNGVRPALRCLNITCLCMLSFLLKDFSQTEQNQLISTPHEQTVDWEKGRTLVIYMGFRVIKFYCFPFPPPPLPLLSSSSSFSFLLLLFPLLLLILLFSSSSSSSFYCLPSSSSFYCFPSSSSASSFLLFFSPPHSIVFYPSPTRFIFFFSSRFYKRLPTAILSSFCSNVSWVNNNRGFLHLLADCPAYQGQFLLKTASPQQLQALVKVLYNIIMGNVVTY